MLTLVVLCLKIGASEGEDWKHFCGNQNVTEGKTSRGERQHFESCIQEESMCSRLSKALLLFLFPPEYFLTGGLDQFLLHSASHALQMQGRQ